MVWTEEAIDKFAELWPTHGPKWDGWDEALGFHVTPYALYSQASKLGLHRKRGARPYSDEEERELLLAVAAFCRKNGRSLGSVARKLSALYARAERDNRAKKSAGI